MTTGTVPGRQQTIRVIYPTGGAARIVLRIEENWQTDIEPIQVNDCTSVFSITTERPFFYFKPVLLRENDAHWSHGANFLAVTTSGAPLDVYPCFREDTHCHVCELTPPLVSASGSAHRFRVFLPPGYYENTLKKYPVLYVRHGSSRFCLCGC